MFEIFVRFFRFCNRENRRKFYASIAIGVANAFCTALKIAAIGITMDGVIATYTQGTAFGIDTIWLSLGVMCVSLIGSIITKKYMSMLQTEGGYRTCAQKRIEIAEHLRYLPMGYFNSNSIGQITSVTTNTMELVGDIATRVVMMVTQGLMDTVFIIVMISFFDWRIALISLAGFILFQLINTFMRWNVRAVSGDKMQADARLVETILEYVQGIAEVKSYNLIGAQSKRLNDIIQHSSQVNIAMEMKCLPLSCVQSFVAKLTGVAIMLASVWFYFNQTMELSTCAVMIVCSFMFFASLEIGGNYSALLRAIDIGVERANEILALPAMDIDGKTIHTNSTQLDADHIVFSYEKKKIIDDITVHIPPNSTTALVGPSGGGKTTLCHLLARFWDVDKGTVELDHTNVRDYNMDCLMQNYSFVFQNVYLFRDTIANNIRFSNPEASMESVIEAAKQACCHDFILALPQGYETVIGEGGASLSGGERQRISIARAILKDAPIIILDEATANVDPENERDLMDAIAALTRKKTVIMIAHRLKTVRHADQILVVDKGQIVESGTHDSLSASGGIYARFIASRREAVSWKIPSSDVNAHR